jgi:hypothetical protein
MTSNLAKLRPRGSQPEMPHLPPIARDLLDDAKQPEPSKLPRWRRFAAFTRRW